ncbi:MAG TPA: hypothetical protein VGM05_14730 [Planctomycetaceae bacterium]|jgi:hypothetical protein
MSHRSTPGNPVSGNLIPPPDLAPGPPAGTTREQRIAMWFDLVDATDEIQLAMLRTRYHTEDEVLAAYREAYVRRVAEHDRTAERMISKLNYRSHSHGG